MKLNNDILSALKRAIDYYGNTSQFAKHIGVAHSTVLFWLSGKTTSISGHVWSSKLRKELHTFMEFQDEFNEIREDHAPFSDSATNLSRKEICQIDFTAMKDFDYTLQSPISFIKTRSSETAVFANAVSDSLFALKLDDPSVCPFLPVGAKFLLSASEYAGNGDLVVGKFRNPAELFLCKYQYSDNMIRLEPLNPAGQTMTWTDKENAEKIFWLYPVLEISINLLNQKWEDGKLVDKI